MQPTARRSEAFNNARRDLQRWCVALECHHIQGTHDGSATIPPNANAQASDFFLEFLFLAQTKMSWRSLLTLGEYPHRARTVFEQLLPEMVNWERSSRWYLVGSEAFPLIGSG